MKTHVQNNYLTTEFIFYFFFIHSNHSCLGTEYLNLVSTSSISFLRKRESGYNFPELSTNVQTRVLWTNNLEHSSYNSFKSLLLNFLTNFNQPIRTHLSLATERAASRYTDRCSLNNHHRNHSPRTPGPVIAYFSSTKTRSPPSLLCLLIVLPPLIAYFHFLQVLLSFNFKYAPKNFVLQHSSFIIGKLF